SIPNFLGNLGEIQPVSGNTKSWQWVIDQLKSYPQTFAQNAETPFIHKELYLNQSPAPIRAAFGICAAHIFVNDGNKSMLNRTLNAEVTELLRPALDETILQALARMQALVLYQIIRMLYGDLEQRISAEQQENSIAASGLQLLRRADWELQGEQPTWKNWILAESIRRTVMVAFMSYAVYSLFKHGICPEFPTLSMLPVSTKANLWGSPGVGVQHHILDKTMKYHEYTDNWCAFPQLDPAPFEKMLLVACKGLDQIEALTFAGTIG
ncbi:hypothetical protein P152DRAFT_367210, partial [Eremomyces bilateralis CBS 781.70]